MIRRQPFDDDDDSPDRWLISYADFITLLFAFFVVMYAISSVNVSKYRALTNSMGNAFSKQLADTEPPVDQIENNPQTTIIKPLPLDYLVKEKYKREREKMSQMGLDISNKLAPQIQDNKIQVLQNNKGIRIDINDSLLFSSGSAELATPAANIIQEIANTLKENNRQIQIEGHTDSTPIHNDSFFSNWELSAVRATTVVRMLTAAGITPTRLSALGYGATQPISSSDTEFGKAKNRRVSIMILYETKSEADVTQEIKPQVASTPLTQ
jgi:chemotaxis protein MotB